MSNSSINVGFSEFIEDNVQELIQTMPWMKDTDMQMCESLVQLHTFIDKIIAKGDGVKKPHCCLDLETTGLNTRLRKGVPIEKIVGFALAIDKNNGIYVPINHKEGKEYNLPENGVLQEIKRLCECAIIIVHNAKFDLQFLKNYGITVENFEDYEDTLILARLHDTGQKEIGLKYLSNKHLGRKMIELDEITKGSHRFDMVSPKLGYVYAASDSLCTYGLFEMYITHSIIIEQMKIYHLEKRLVPVVMQMEQNLILIDKEYLQAEKIRITERLEQIRKTIIEAVGRDFNIGSTQQLGRILFEDPLHYEYPEKERTAKGFYKTDTAVLEKIQDRYPLVKQMVSFRKLEKALGTYVENLLNNCDEDGYIKVGFSQNGTDTGRFSSPGGRGINEDGYCGVNVQSIPANYDVDAPDVRKAVKARPGKKIVAMDFSGEELRVAANLSKEKKWVDEFNIGSGDLHTTTGKAIFKKEEISKAERQIAKCVARGTLIASEKGWRPIENIKVGDLVYTHKLELKPVEKVWDMGKKPGLTLSARGTSITCGLNHLFLDEKIDLKKVKDKDWIRADDVVVGQKLQVALGKITIKSKKYHSSVDLMDLTVKDDHTYIAQRFITHNTCNFQILYGSGPRGIAEQAKISETEARRAVDGFLTGLPTLAAWIKAERNIARKFKRAITPFGRIRPLEMFYDSGDKGQEAHGDRCAVNFKIQGSCADIMKIVMVRVSNWIKTKNLQDEVKILLTMHDELVFEMPEDKLAEYIPQLNNIMCMQDTLQGMLHWPVPFAVDAEYGDTWHVDHDFFKENPELKKVKEDVTFHQNTLVVEPGIPQPVDSESPKTDPLPNVNVPSISDVLSNVNLAEDAPLMTSVPDQVVKQESMPSDSYTIEETDEEIIFTIKDRSKVNLCRINQVITFLTETKDIPEFEGRVKTLKIKDQDDFILTVSNLKVRNDAFYALALFLGI